VVSTDVLNEATRRLVEKFHPDRIILFGSQARGTANKHSDVDLLVIGYFEGERLLLMTDMDRALWGLGFPRDIIVLTPDEYERDKKIPGTIARPASREGRTLYERH